MNQHDKFFENHYQLPAKTKAEISDKQYLLSLQLFKVPPDHVLCKKIWKPTATRN